MNSGLSGSNEYRGYKVQQSSSEIFIRDRKGNIVGKVDTDDEAKKFIDDLLLSQDTHSSDNDKKYIVRRIRRDERSINYSSYQVYTEDNQFKYNVKNGFKKMSKSEAESLIKRFKLVDNGNYLYTTDRISA